MDVSYGLVNGAIGHIVTDSSSEVSTVLVKFDNDQVGLEASQSSQYRGTHPIQGRRQGRCFGCLSTPPLHLPDSLPRELKLT